MMRLLMGETWHRARDLAVVDRGDRVVILNLGRLSSAPVVLKGTAAEVWRLIDDATSETRLLGAVARTFDVHPGLVRDDVRDFLRHLSDLGLITRSGESS
jgi:hypothetical protein